MSEPARPIPAAADVPMYEGGPLFEDDGPLTPEEEAALNAECDAILAKGEPRMSADEFFAELGFRPGE
jgi:hypothetical protein